jgi:predicted O-methyltransferase YrrM
MATAARRKSSRSHDLKQLEAYISLIGVIRPKFPFPAMSNTTAIAPDMGLILASKVLERVPKLVVELGSGVSTLVIGYCLKRNGTGKLISVEHDQHYADHTEASIKLHGLEGYVEVVCAPVTPLRIKDAVWPWYDVQRLNSIARKSIDLLVIDGPPGKLHELARYPALPVFKDMLRPDAIVIVDDAKRSDEREMMARWLDECRSLQSMYLKTVKGTRILTMAG